LSRAGDGLEEAVGALVGGDQRFDLGPQLRAARAALVEEARALGGVQLDRVPEQLRLSPGSGLGAHAAARSMLGSQARAN
jgi:hypothetical protein